MGNRIRLRTGALSHLHRIVWSATLILPLVSATRAPAADAVAGTISCKVSSEQVDTLKLVGFSFKPYLSDDAHTIGAHAVNS